MVSLKSADTLHPTMSQSSVLKASGAAFVMLLVWWGGILHLDGVLAARFPYHQYEILALLYPDVFYPALPGWILAHAQPFSIGFWLVAFGWMIALPVGIGVVAARYASGHSQSPTAIATVFVLALFVAVTVIEAAATLLG